MAGLVRSRKVQFRPLCRSFKPAPEEHSATIEHGQPHFVRGRFQRTRDLAIEHLCIISLAGPAAEELFCGPITDSGDKVDLRIARGYLEPYFPAIALGAHLHRLRAAAQRLVIDAKPKIKLIADALIAYGSLTGDEVYELLSSASRRRASLGNVHIIASQTV
jgi:hypothetical protein